MSDPHLDGIATALWPLVINRAAFQTRIDGVVERTSHLPQGAVWFEFFQTKQGKLIRFPQLADFLFDPHALSAGIYATPTPETDRVSIEHLFHNNVVPMLLADRGALMLHGAAVDLGGFAIAFIGVSGRGKSTLAASFAANGFPFLSDDSICLEPTDASYVAQPSYPSIRLWRDSDEAVLAGRAKKMRPVTFSDKARYAAGDEIPHAAEPTPLRAIYVLARDGVSAATIKLLGANEAMMEFVQHSFILDIHSPDTLGGHFERMAALAKKTPAYRLDYPRDYSQLPDVRALIIGHASTLN